MAGDKHSQAVIVVGAALSGELPLRRAIPVQQKRAYWKPVNGTSPGALLGVQDDCQSPGSIESATKCTLPSSVPTLTPPGWLLRGAQDQQAIARVGECADTRCLGCADAKRGPAAVAADVVGQRAVGRVVVMIQRAFRIVHHAANVLFRRRNDLGDCGGVRQAVRDRSEGQIAIDEKCARVLGQRCGGRPIPRVVGGIAFGHRTEAVVGGVIAAGVVLPARDGPIRGANHHRQWGIGDSDVRAVPSEAETEAEVGRVVKFRLFEVVERIGDPSGFFAILVERSQRPTGAANNGPAEAAAWTTRNSARPGGFV